MDVESNQTGDTDMNAQIIIKNNSYAVEFEVNGRTYRTLFTLFRNEACAWGRAIEQTGWVVSGRPMPVK